MTMIALQYIAWMALDYTGRYQFTQPRGSHSG